MPKPRRKPAKPFSPFGSDEIRALPTRDARKNAAEISSSLTHAEKPNIRQFVHHKYDAIRLEMRGPKVAINRTASPLDLYYGSHRKITLRQKMAGERFEEMYRLIGFVRAGRDPFVAAMDLGIVVRGESAQDASARFLDAERMVDRIRRCLEPVQYSTLIDVAVNHQYIGKSRGARGLGYVALIVALNTCADELRMPEYEGG